MIRNYLVRLANKLLICLLYKINVYGRENLPKKTGALLVCNHISFMDGSIVQAAINRPIRFLMDYSLYKLPIVKQIVSASGAIPIAGRSKPEIMKEALEKAKLAVRNGELVGIFAEGQLSRHGNMNTFKSGLEKIMLDKSEPIIPIYLDQVWGSIFSFSDKKFFWKKPKSIPYQVSLNIGKALPANTKAQVVKQKVSELSVDSFAKRSEAKKSILEISLNNLNRNRKKTVLIDSQQYQGQDILNLYLRIKRNLVKVMNLNDNKATQIIIYSDPSAYQLATVLALLANNISPVVVNKNTSNIKEVAMDLNIQTVIADEKDFELEKGYNVLITKDLCLANPLLDFYGKYSLTNKMPNAINIHVYDPITQSTQTLKSINIIAAISSISQIAQFNQVNYLTTKLSKNIINQFIFSYFLPLEINKVSIISNLLDNKHAHQTSLITDAEIIPPNYLSIVLVNTLSTDSNCFAALSHAQVAGLIAANIPDYKEGVFNQIGRKANSYGHYLPNSACKILNDNQEEINLNEVGILWVKSYANLNAAAGNWLNTELKFRMDKDGFLFSED